MQKSTAGGSIPKWQFILAIVALFLSSFSTLADNLMAAVANSVYIAFADAPEALINFTLTGPSLIGIPACLVAGILCDRFDKKAILVFGFAVFVVGANFATAIDNIYYFLFMRILYVSVGWGVTATAALAILADMFSDENEHAKYVGWYNAVMAAFGSAIAIVAGNLAVGDWQNAFHIYWISIPILVMVVIFVPSGKKLRSMRASRGEASAPETAAAISADSSESIKRWWVRPIPFYILVFVIQMCFLAMMYMISVYVEGAGVGDAAFAGTLTSIQGICTLVFSFLFGFFFKKMHDTVHLVPIIGIGVCFIVMGAFPTQPVALFASALIGCLWGILYSWFWAHCVDIVPASKAGTSTGIVNVVTGFGTLCTSYLFTGLMGLGFEPAQAWGGYGVILVVVGAICVVAYLASRKKSAHGGLDLEAEK